MKKDVNGLTKVTIINKFKKKLNIITLGFERTTEDMGF